MTAPGATQFLTTEDGHIAYDDTSGDGPLVVCLPGLGDRRQVYRRLTPLLAAAGYRVVTVDLRGHGESSTHWPDHSPTAVGRDLLALLRHLDATPAVVVGLSFSPAAAIWAAAEAPDLTAGLVLISAWADDPRPNWLTRAAASLVGRSPTGWAWFYRSLYRNTPADLPEYLRDLRRNLRQPGRLAALRAMMWASKTEANRRLVDVNAPVLVVMGGQDPDFPSPAAEAGRIAERAQDAEVVLLDGVGHYPPAERPELLAEAMLPFLTKVTGHGR